MAAEDFNIDNEGPVLQSATDGEVAEMVLNKGDRNDKSDDEDNTFNTMEKAPMDNVVKMCDGLNEGLEQRAITTKQESVYTIKNKLPRQKPFLMR